MFYLTRRSPEHCFVPWWTSIVGSYEFFLCGRSLQLDGQKEKLEEEQDGFHRHTLRRGNVSLQVRWLMLAYKLLSQTILFIFFFFKVL